MPVKPYKTGGFPIFATVKPSWGPTLVAKMPFSPENSRSIATVGGRFAPCRGIAGNVGQPFHINNVLVYY
jgi:hypothetical protein